MQAVQDYVSRGRRLEHTPEEALAGEWIHLIRAWAKAPEMGHDPRRVDIEAEYSLRGLKPPHELVRDEMETIIQATAGAIEDMDKLDRDRLNSEILDLRSREVTDELIHPASSHVAGSDGNDVHIGLFIVLALSGEWGSL